MARKLRIERRHINDSSFFINVSCVVGMLRDLTPNFTVRQTMEKLSADLDKQVPWVRPYYMFLEPVQHEGATVPRFQRVVEPRNTRIGD